MNEINKLSADQKVKFYQKGTFTVGNRLVDADTRSVQASMDRSNAITCGHRACQGCGEALGARYALDTVMRMTGGNAMAVNATGCLEVFTTPYPETSWQLPWLHSLFGNAPAVASGVAAAMKAKGKDTRIIAQGGDGGTVDIGFGCLSGMFERNDDVLYICYDNEAYMNTGVQRSGATPGGARTATTMPVNADNPGNVFGTGKNLPRIAMAHGIPYVATASVGYLQDLEQKVERAMSFKGARYLHIYVPCPLGWGSASHDTIKLARLAVETGLFPLYEAMDGRVVSSRSIRRRVQIETYLKPQRRFAHLFKSPKGQEAIQNLQAMCDANIKEFDLLRSDEEASV
ncbi:MAG: thiamine pyrophosphate-dependent enzyme [Rhodospirillaceae bacterium]